MAATSPLKVDPATDSLITHSAHFLGISKKEFVSRAVSAYVSQHRSELEDGLRAAAAMLDGSRAAEIALLADVDKDDVDRLGGMKS
jgi:hypothetical protein